MAVDVQPLSRRRRTVMLIVMLGLFCASLGFAEYIVVNHRRAASVSADLEALGFNKVLPDMGVFPGYVTGRLGAVDGRERAVAIYYNFERVEAPNQLQYATSVFGSIFDAVPTKKAQLLLNGRLWMEVSGPIDDTHFAIVRLSTVAGHPLIICFSGPVPRTDADNRVLDNICISGIRIGATTQKKQEPQ